MTEAPTPRAAFLGDPAVRQAALAVLAAEPAASPAGAPLPMALSQRVAADADQSAWERRLGLPLWLALVVDALPAVLANGRDAPTAATRLLGAIRPGADVMPTGSRLLAHWLADPADGAARHAHTPELAALVEEAAALQRRCVAGDVPANSDWKSLRGRVGALVEASTEQSVAGLVARCVEVSCWNPARSRSTVVDTLYAWLKLQRLVDDIATGWGPDAHERMRARLDGIHTAAIAQGATPGRVDVFTLLEQSHPDEAAALRAHIARDRTESAARMQRALQTIADRLESAA